MTGDYSCTTLVLLRAYERIAYFDDVLFLLLDFLRKLQCRTPVGSIIIGYCHLVLLIIRSSHLLQVYMTTIIDHIDYVNVVYMIYATMHDTVRS